MLVEQRKPLEVVEITLPEALEPGQVLVRVHLSGICGSQLGEIAGVKGPDRWLPHLLGHEGAGTVLEIGPGVTHVAPGDAVVLHWRKGLGMEARTPKYGWGDRTVNAGWVTTFNELAVVSENRLTPVPAEAPREVLPLLGCAVTTGFGAVQNDARVQIGESVVVFGAGGVGLNMVQAAAMTSAHPIIAVDLFDTRLELARRIGASHVVNASTSDAGETIAAILDQLPLDVFIDNTGQPAVIELGYRLTGPEGRVILVGVPTAGNDIRLHSLPLHFGKVLTGSHGGDAAPERDIPRYLRLFQQGRLALRELITETFPLERINEALDGMRDGSVSGRCLIEL